MQFHYLQRSQYRSILYITLLPSHKSQMKKEKRTYRILQKVVSSGNGICCVHLIIVKLCQFIVPAMETFKTGGGRKIKEELPILALRSQGENTTDVTHFRESMSKRLTNCCDAYALKWLTYGAIFDKIARQLVWRQISCCI